MSGDFLAGLRIRIDPGPAVVASLPGALLVVPSVDEGQRAALDALFSAASGVSVVRAVVRVMADFDRLPAFCLVIDREADPPFAIVHGAVLLRAHGGGHEVRLSGLEARSWVDRALPSGIDHLAIRLPGADGADGRALLEATLAAGGPGEAPWSSGLTSADASSAPGTDGGGAVTGDRGRAVLAGAQLSPSGSSSGFRPEPVRFDQGGRMEAASPSPAGVNGCPDSPAAAVAAPSTPEAAATPGDAEETTVRSPASPMPIQSATQILEPPDPGALGDVLAPPVAPPFNPLGVAAPPAPSPDSSVTSEARDVVGRLVMENGPNIVVDADCVIGRNPEADPDVMQGRAKPVVLPDDEQRISRVHARLVHTEAGVEIVDAGSVNGTWIEPPGGGGWIAMVPRVPAPLPLGSRIQVGDLVLSYAPLEGED